MKFMSILFLIFLVFTTANTQNFFDYERFLTVFMIKFDYERFVQTFFSNSPIITNQVRPPFNYDEFVKTFFILKGDNPEITDKNNLSVEPESSVIPNEPFDIETFMKVFNLGCKGQCQKDFKYERFVETFNLRDSKEKFDYERFLDSFNLKFSDKPFDWDRFVNTFLLTKNWPAFDYERFFKTFFSSVGKTQNEGAVLIVDGISGAV